MDKEKLKNLGNWEVTEIMYEGDDHKRLVDCRAVGMPEEVFLVEALSKVLERKYKTLDAITWEYALIRTIIYGKTAIKLEEESV